MLGFLWPGIGYLYAGRGLHGLVLLLLFPVAELSMYLVAVLIPVPVVCVAIPAVLKLALRLGFARGAARAASEFPPDRPLPFFSRWYACLSALVLTAGLSLLWAHGYRTTFVQAFKIPTGAMEPTMLIGDRLLVVKWTYGWREPLFGHVISGARQPTRGELIVFRFPEDRSRAFIMRCIGLPGETVEIRGGTVFIEGKPLHERYVRFLRPYGSAHRDPDPIDPLAIGGQRSCRWITISFSGITVTTPGTVGSGDSCRRETCLAGPRSCTGPIGRPEGSFTNRPHAAAEGHAVRVRTDSLESNRPPLGIDPGEDRGTRFRWSESPWPWSCAASLLQVEVTSALENRRCRLDQREDGEELRQPPPGLGGREALLSQLSRGGDELARHLPGQDAIGRGGYEVQCDLLTSGVPLSQQ